MTELNAEKNASEAKLIISGMQEKMAEFEAELFTVKNQNYLLNAELQALKAEIAEKDRNASQEEMDWSQGGEKVNDKHDNEVTDENFQQLEDLNRMKHSGFDRVNIIVTCVVYNTKI